MSFVQDTGKTKIRECELCGEEVLHKQRITLRPERRKYWAAEKHSAACGLPCWGGGVSMKELEGTLHGRAEGTCSICGDI